MNKLIREIERHSRDLPDNAQQEVLDFIKYKESKLKDEEKNKLETSILSETALLEWNNEEEERAWKSFQ